MPAPLKNRAEPPPSREIREGDLVRLKYSRSTKTARVQCLLPDIEGGVLLTEKLDQFRYWNVADLEIVS